jgi:hypothetical protein
MVLAVVVAEVTTQVLAGLVVMGLDTAAVVVGAALGLPEVWVESVGQRLLFCISFKETHHAYLFRQHLG